ncbi:short chain dehydrogenase, putative [Bodo saltans]|uniref:Short chain dehydrogenase, putative n=1 Tax=Bodo saltans TaxID=75058 RepID=A0A0S4IR33_BODSA|nr:short chain dehydrogenase, putative [Bodo saltans]|eukprot:CUF35323.1 short chain dehydrogenase, putative [Bodo saltans]
MAQLASSAMQVLKSVIVSPKLSRAFQILGAAFVALEIFRATRVAGRYLLPRSSAGHLKAKYAKAGSWAVVTGASDGIGRALALELAAIGFNVCVIARTQSKLDEVVGEITTKNPTVQAKALSFDFGTTSNEAYADLFAQLDALEIAVLVNNVGISHTNAELFEDPSVADDLKLLTVNCEPMIRLCKYIVPKLKAKRSGAIVNLSSLSAVVTAVPYLATYAGTKAFNQTFSTSLAYELQPFGVDVLTVTPGMVSTGMTQGSAARRPRVNFGMVDSAVMARDTLAQLGRVISTAGHHNHDLQTSIVSSLPLWYVGPSTYKLFKKISDARKRKAAAASVAQQNE